jgi:hypothetical protein
MWFERQGNFGLLDGVKTQESHKSSSAVAEVYQEMREDFVNGRSHRARTLTVSSWWIDG